MGNLVFQATLGGQVNLVGPNTASTFNLNVPAVAGNLVTTGDSGTVTNTMLATSAYTAPGTIGSGTANTGAFTTLSASSTVSGTGFSTYLASPPAIGGTAAAAGTFTTLTGSTSVTTPIVKSASSLTLQTNGTTTAITVDTSQNVGIGETSPAGSAGYTQLVIKGTSGAELSLKGGTTQYGYVYVDSGGFRIINPQSGASSGTMQFSTSNTERMRIDNSGNVGIGTSSPSNSKLDIASGNINLSDTYILAWGGGTARPNIEGSKASNYLRFSTGAGATHMAIDSSGNVGIGTTSPNLGGVNKALTLNSAASSNCSYELAVNGTLQGSLYTAVGSSALNLATFVNGPLTFATNSSERMRIDSSGNVALGQTSASGRMDIASTGAQFYLRYTGNSGFNSLTSDVSNNLIFTQFAGERMRLDGSGNLLVGTTSTSSPASGTSINMNSGGSFQDIGHASGTASGTRYVGFIYNSGLIGSITQSGTTAVLYNLTSDQRLKENIQDADSASALIDAIQVRKFDWKSDSSHQRYGFIAQELVTVAPEAVYQPTDTEEMMAVDYSKLVPMLIKEVQSLRVRVAQLETN